MERSPTLPASAPAAVPARARAAMPSRITAKRNIENATWIGSNGRTGVPAGVVVRQALRLQRNAECRKVAAGQPAVLGRAAAPADHAELQVGHRTADGGQLPVQHGDYARLRGMEHHVADAEVAVHQRDGAVIRRQGRQQEAAQLAQLRDVAEPLGVPLLAPARRLAVGVAAGPASRSVIACVSAASKPSHLDTPAPAMAAGPEVRPPGPAVGHPGDGHYRKLKPCQPLAAHPGAAAYGKAAENGPRSHVAAARPPRPYSVARGLHA